MDISISKNDRISKIHVNHSKLNEISKYPYGYLDTFLMFINYNFLRFASIFNSIIVIAIKGQWFDIELILFFFFTGLDINDCFS